MTASARLHQDPPARHAAPDPAALRARAAGLADFATAIECSPAMALGDVHLGDVVASPHAAVAARLVSRSLHQLHVAADELRSCAHELVDCAVRIERDRDVAA